MVGISAEQWLPDMDLNHDKQIQSLLCYRYTIGQTSAVKVEFSCPESRMGRDLAPIGAGTARPCSTTSNDRILTR